MNEPEPLRYHLRYRSFKPETLAATERFFASNPWAGTSAEKDAKFKAWLEAVSGIYEVPVPGFAVVPEDECPHGGGYFQGNIILPKYSVLTTMHSFRYHSQFFRPLEERKIRIIGPDDARAWSQSLYFRVRPEQYLRAVEEGKVYFP